MTRVEDIEANKAFNLRRLGIFFLLGGLVFLLKRLFGLSDFVTWLLFLAVEFVYVFALPEKNTSSPPLSFAAKSLRFLIQLSLLITLCVLIIAAVVWLWQMTGILPDVLLGIVLIAGGFVLLGWSYLRVRMK